MTNELGLTASTCPKSMLIVAEDTIVFKVARDADDIFQDLAYD